MAQHQVVADRVTAQIEGNGILHAIPRRHRFHLLSGMEEFLASFNICSSSTAISIFAGRYFCILAGALNYFGHLLVLQTRDPDCGF